ncbi:unnamed protein product [Brassica oleracea var. botrytis]
MCCPLRAPFSLSRNASLLVIFARIFLAEIDAEIQRDEEIVDGDGEDIGARDGVGTDELESGFGRITTSNPSPGRERLAQSLRELVECSVCRSKLVSRVYARHQKVGEKPLLSVSTFVHWEALALLLIGISVNQLRSLPEGSHVDVGQRNKCHSWTSGYGHLSTLRTGLWSLWSQRRRLLGSEPIISSVIIFTSPASVILGESASSSPPSLSSVAAASRIGVDHFFRHHLHFSSVGVVHPRRVGVIISAVTQIRCCGNQRNPPPSAVKVLKEMLLRFTLAAKESDYFVVSKQLELEISLTLAAKESFQSLVYIIYLSNRSIIERLLSKPFYSNRRVIFRSHSSSFNGRVKEDDEASHKGGKAENVERYRALLRLSNEHRLSEIEWHQAASKANSIASQIELLEEIIKAKGKFDFTAELEKLKEELMEADGMLADVKVKVLDWCKLEEKWLLDE